MNLHLTTEVIVVTILATAFAALLSQMALAVFNDGVRPFLLDFYRGELKRPQMTAIAFGLSAGFIFGLGVPIAFSSGVLNPWVLFLPSDILGILSPKRWLAPILGAAWGAVVVFGLQGATTLANSLPVNFLTAMQQMSTPILYLFAFFPAVAIAMQFGRVRGLVAFIVSVLVMIVTMKWLTQLFPGATTMAAGVILLIAFAIFEDLRAARSTRATAESAGADAPPDTAPGEPMPGVSGTGTSAGTQPASIAVATASQPASIAVATASQPASIAVATASQPAAAVDETSSIFAANAARLRKFLPYFIVMGVLVGVLANTHLFAGGEATSYIIAKGQYANAAQIDFYRALGFIPLIVTTAIASGAFQIVGFTLIYPIAYLAPNPVIAGVAGGVLFGVEVLLLSYIARWISLLRNIRDASDNIRNAINITLEVAILFGSIAAANAMAGGAGIAVVGGLYALNEVLGRPVIRMAAGPVGVILAGILFNLLAWAALFTPIAIK